MKPFQFGFIIGRFNPIHAGHERMINFGMDVCDDLLVLVGSSQEEGTVRNPFNVFDRISLIREIYGDKVKVGHIPDLTHENDITPEWGRYVLKTVEQWATIYGINKKPDVTIYGNDENRGGWYDTKDIQYMAQLIIPRSNINISATEVRQALALGWKSVWERNTNFKIHNKYNYLRGKLLEIPYYRELQHER